MTGAPARPVLYVIGCAAPPVLRVHAALASARALGWDACLVLTPTAARWLEQDLPALTMLTGRPVRSEYQLPGEPRVLPPPDALLVAPATGNTMNKLAAGISDTLALGLVNEGIGTRIPIVLLPCLGNDRVHPAFPRTVATLREAGIGLLLPGEGARAAEHPGERTEFPWQLGLASLPRPRPRSGSPASAASPSFPSTTGQTPVPAPRAPHAAGSGPMSGGRPFGESRWSTR